MARRILSSTRGFRTPRLDDDDTARDFLPEDRLVEDQEDESQGPVVNSILAYLNRVGEAPLLTREEERDLAIAMEEGTAATFTHLVAIPFARDHLMAFPRRLATGEVLLGDVASLEEAGHEEWTPALSGELDEFMAKVDGVIAKWRQLRRARATAAEADPALAAGLYECYESFRFGPGIVRVVIRSILQQVDRLAGGTGEDFPGQDARSFGTLDLAAGVLAGAASAPAGELSLGISGDDLGRAVSGVLASQRKVADARSRMIRSNLRLVVSIAKHYMSREMPLLDLVQEGNIGLMKAVSRFDWRFGHRFSTYATWWIRQSVTRALAEHGRTIRVPLHWVECLGKTQRRRAELRRALGREPTNLELAKDTGYTVEQIEHAESAMVRTVSLETPIGEDDAQLMDMVEDPNSTQPLEEAVADDLRLGMRRLLAGLSPKEEAVIRMRYGIGVKQEYTLEEVGEAVGLTRERVRQIELQAVARLKNPALLKEFDSYLDE